MPTWHLLKQSNEVGIHKNDAVLEIYWDQTCWLVPRCSNDFGEHIAMPDSFKMMSVPKIGPTRSTIVELLMQSCLIFGCNLTGGLRMWKTLKIHAIKTHAEGITKPSEHHLFSLITRVLSMPDDVIQISYAQPLVNVLSTHRHSSENLLWVVVEQPFYY